MDDEELERAIVSFLDSAFGAIASEPIAHPAVPPAVPPAERPLRTNRLRHRLGGCTPLSILNLSEAFGVPTARTGVHCNVRGLPCRRPETCGLFGCQQTR